MNGEKVTTAARSRAQGLHDAAERAANIAALAALLDAQLVRACGDLLAMAAAAKQLAAALEKAADRAEVAL